MIKNYSLRLFNDFSFDGVYDFSVSPITENVIFETDLINIDFDNEYYSMVVKVSELPEHTRCSIDLNGDGNYTYYFVIGKEYINENLFAYEYVVDVKSTFPKILNDTWVTRGTITNTVFSPTINLNYPRRIIKSDMLQQASDFLILVNSSSTTPKVVFPKLLNVDGYPTNFSVVTRPLLTGNERQYTFKAFVWATMRVKFTLGGGNTFIIDLGVNDFNVIPLETVVKTTPLRAETGEDVCRVTIPASKNALSYAIYGVSESHPEITAKLEIKNKEISFDINYKGEISNASDELSFFEIVQPTENDTYTGIFANGICLNKNIVSIEVDKSFLQLHGLEKSMDEKSNIDTSEIFSIIDDLYADGYEVLAIQVAFFPINYSDSNQIEHIKGNKREYPVLKKVNAFATSIVVPYSNCPSILSIYGNQVDLCTRSISNNLTITFKPIVSIEGGLLIGIIDYYGTDDNANILRVSIDNSVPYNVKAFSDWSLQNSQAEAINNQAKVEIRQNAELKQKEIDYQFSKGLTNMAIQSATSLVSGQFNVSEAIKTGVAIGNSIADKIHKSNMNAQAKDYAISNQDARFKLDLDSIKNKPDLLMGRSSGYALITSGQANIKFCYTQWNDYNLEQFLSTYGFACQLPYNRRSIRGPSGFLSLTLPPVNISPWLREIATSQLNFFYTGVVGQRDLALDTGGQDAPPPPAAGVGVFDSDKKFIQLNVSKSSIINYTETNASIPPVDSDGGVPLVTSAGQHVDINFSGKFDSEATKLTITVANNRMYFNAGAKYFQTLNTIYKPTDPITPPPTNPDEDRDAVTLATVRGILTDKEYGSIKLMYDDRIGWATFYVPSVDYTPVDKNPKVKILPIRDDCAVAYPTAAKLFDDTRISRIMWITQNPGGQAIWVCGLINDIAEDENEQGIFTIVTEILNGDRTPKRLMIMQSEGCNIVDFDNASDHMVIQGAYSVNNDDFRLNYKTAKYVTSELGFAVDPFLNLTRGDKKTHKPIGYGFIVPYNIGPDDTDAHLFTYAKFNTNLSIDLNMGRTLGYATLFALDGSYKDTNYTPQLINRVYMINKLKKIIQSEHLNKYLDYCFWRCTNGFGNQKLIHQKLDVDNDINPDIRFNYLTNRSDSGVLNFIRYTDAGRWGPQSANNQDIRAVSITEKFVQRYSTFDMGVSVKGSVINIKNKGV